MYAIRSYYANRFPFSPGFYLIIFLSLFLLAVLPVLSGLPAFFQTAQEFAPAVESLNSFPLAFVPSQDQSAGAAAFESLSMNGSLAFTSAGLSLKLPAVGDLSGQSLHVITSYSIHYTKLYDGPPRES